MERCETTEVCSFFNNKLKAMPSITKRLKQEYCEHNKSSCARYMIKKKLRQGYSVMDEQVLITMEQSLSTMFPNDTAKAEEIIRQMVK